MAEISPEKEPRKEYIVSGRVQRVGYRYFVRQSALSFGVKGRVKNLANGKVRVRACGLKLAEFAKTLWKGNRFVRVDEIEVRELSETYKYENFCLE